MNFKQRLASWLVLNAGGDALYTDAKSRLFSLQPQEEKTVLVKLTEPQGVWTRLLVRVPNDDEVLAGWDSEWCMPEAAECLPHRPVLRRKETLRCGCCRGKGFE